MFVGPQGNELQCVLLGPVRPSLTCSRPMEVHLKSPCPGTSCMSSLGVTFNSRTDPPTKVGSIKPITPAKLDMIVIHTGPSASDLGAIVPGWETVQV